MSKIESFKDLIVWQKAMKLVRVIYKNLDLPDEEKFGLQSQIRRSSVSIPSNIAEGWGRSSKSFVNFLKIARGSLYELETQVLILIDLNYIEDS